MLRTHLKSESVARSPRLACPGLTTINGTQHGLIQSHPVNSLAVIAETFPWSPPITMVVASNSPVYSKAVFSPPTPLQKSRSEVFGATGLPLKESTLIRISEPEKIAAHSHSQCNASSTIHLSDMHCRPLNFALDNFESVQL